MRHGLLYGSGVGCRRGGKCLYADSCASSGSFCIAAPQVVLSLALWWLVVMNGCRDALRRAVVRQYQPESLRLWRTFPPQFLQRAHDLGHKHKLKNLNPLDGVQSNLRNQAPKNH